METSKSEEVKWAAMAMQDAIDWPDDYEGDAEKTRRAFLRGVEMAQKIR